jgi:hypothetical protein
MKKQSLKSKYDYPPRQRRLLVHSWFVILFGVIIAMIFLMSCSAPRRGCYGTKGMAGYSWIKCKETKQVFILDKKGAIVCTYQEH